jgi:hypothetical protein
LKQTSMFRASVGLFVSPWDGIIIIIHVAFLFVFLFACALALEF